MKKKAKKTAKKVTKKPPPREPTIPKGDRLSDLEVNIKRILDGQVALGKRLKKLEALLDEQQGGINVRQLHDNVWEENGLMSRVNDLEALILEGGDEDDVAAE